ncbi:hypothetical protein V2G26_000889 [Clonostachys chloroleuca]
MPGLGTETPTSAAKGPNRQSLAHTPVSFISRTRRRPSDGFRTLPQYPQGKVSHAHISSHTRCRFVPSEHVPLLEAGGAPGVCDRGPGKSQADHMGEHGPLIGPLSVEPGGSTRPFS